MQRSPAAEHRLALFQMHVAVVLAGATGLFPKLVSAGPMVIACVRSFFGALTLLVIGRLLKAPVMVRDRRTFVALAVSGAVLALHWFTFFQAIRISTVAIGVLGFGSITLFSTFLEPIVFRERLRGVDVIAGVLVVGGLMLITPEFRMENTHTQGLLWGVASGFLYSVFFLITRSSVRTMPAVTVAMIQQAFSSLVLLPWVWYALAATPSRDWVTLLLLGVVFTGVLQWLTASSLRHLSVQTNSVLLSLEPVYAVVLAWGLLHERPDLRTVLGGTVLFGTVLWTSLSGKRSE